MHAFKLGLRCGSDHNKGRKLGKSSKYHYVSEVHDASKGEHFFRTIINYNGLNRSRQFSVKKYGKLEAERMAAKAANDLILSHKEFDGLALNDFPNSSNDYPHEGVRSKLLAVEIVTDQNGGL
jgi:hypothetical protein